MRQRNAGQRNRRVETVSAHVLAISRINADIEVQPYNGPSFTYKHNSIEMTDEDL